MLHSVLQRLRRFLQGRPAASAVNTADSGDLKADFKERGPVYARYARLYLEKGETTLVASLLADRLTRKEESLLLRQLAEGWGDVFRRHTLPLATLAWDRCPDPYSARTLAAGLYAAGSFSEALRLLESRDGLKRLSGSWQWFGKELCLLRELAAGLPVIPPKTDTPAFTPRPDALLWLAPGSVAFGIDTPSIRIYEMAEALLPHFPEALIATRPGYPRRKQKAFDATVGSLTYRHTPYPADFEAEGGPLAWSIRHFEKLLHAHRPIAVVAASDPFSALPALIAAKRLGVPYLLDPAPSVPSNPTELSALAQKIDAHCAAHADAVITTPNPLALPPHIAPRLSEAVFTLGFIAEDADSDPDAILKAVAQLESPVHLEIVSPLSANLALRVAALGLSPDRFTFSPLPPALLLREWMSRLDAVILPAGFSDYRLLEATALGVPTIATTPLPAMEGAPQPICIPPGDTSALADAIASLVNTPGLRDSFRSAGRQWAADHRIGPNAVAPLVKRLNTLAEAILAKDLAVPAPPPTPLPVEPASRVMLLTRRYPSPGDFYNYAFVHTRTRAYTRHDQPLDLYKVNPDTPLSEMEYEGIRVISCEADVAKQMAGSGKYQVVLIHFLTPYLWDIVRRHLDDMKVIVWVHCVEVQSWWRRGFEWETESADFLERRKIESAGRTAFWRRLFLNPHPNLHFVFVSQYFAGECFEDLGVTLPKEHYSIIHNLINTDFYTYQPKTAEHRLRLLSIRSYHNRKYANDLTIGAILELSKRPFFRELEFRLMGDGALFDTLTAPLRQFDNVTIKRGFVLESELVSTFAEHGVLLTPTRMDAQGVSRDEAMASGLVAITSNVAAIPEFVDAECGIVTEPEDPIAIADAVEYLYHHPEEYLKLSAAAAARVRRQSGFEQTMMKELRLIQSALGQPSTPNS